MNRLVIFLTSLVLSSGCEMRKLARENVKYNRLTEKALDTNGYETASRYTAKSHQAMLKAISTDTTVMHALYRKTDTFWFNSGKMPCFEVVESAEWRVFDANDTNKVYDMRKFPVIDSQKADQFFRITQQMHKRR